MRVKSHDANVNAVIGGPHRSFQHLAQNIGGVSVLFTNLSCQLQNYQQFGPPRIERALMSCEDLRLSGENLNLSDAHSDAIIEVNRDVKDALSNVTFDLYNFRPNISNNSGLTSTKSMLENPMLSTFEAVSKLHFSSQVAGELLVFKQENKGSMVVDYLFKPVRVKLISLQSEKANMLIGKPLQLMVTADDKIDVVYEVDPNVDHTQSTLNNVKVGEGYSRLKGYINEEFMQESVLKVSEIPAVSYQNMVRSDFCNYVVAYFNFKHFGQVIKMKVGKYIRLFLIS